MTNYYDSYEKAAQNIIKQIGNVIVIGVPLGLGKPIGLLNALYRLACGDKSIELTILTGLTLARPSIHNDLEKKFLEPILDRLLHDYEDPLYEKARRLQQLPSNIRVIEFFLAPGEYLNNSYVQQNYISSAYARVVSDTVYYSINVLAQQVSHSDTDMESYSLSCNTDLFHQVSENLQQAKLDNKSIAIIAEINSNLPYMPGNGAVVKSDIFTHIIDTKHYHALFPLPRDEISVQNHLMGLYTSCLIKDDSCIQIGIGKFSNAVANALIMRHKNNDIYTDILNKLAVNTKFKDTISSIGSFELFDKGLYASTEMFSDDYMHLYTENILKKRVYDHIGLQKLLNSQIITENITSDMIDNLIKHNLIDEKLTTENFQFLLNFGIFKQNIKYHDGYLVLASGDQMPADLTSPQVKKWIIENCLGRHLESGKILHAAFFLGSSTFYKQLHDLPLTELNQFEMTSVARTNTLSWSYELAQLQRTNARFINSAMMVTLGGAVISDGLKNIQEVSGVGGQFDFVSMAGVLPHARSIILCHSVRKSKHTFKSNIVWNYSNQTIPRYLRDIVVSEYGIADCRWKTDSEVIKSLLNITDTRFQEMLLKKAKKYGKIPNDYEIPNCFQQNTPEYIEPIIKEFRLKGYCTPYPFGSDLTEDEQIIKRALLALKNLTKFKLIIITFITLLTFQGDKKFDKYLTRMQLKHPKNIKDYIYKKLLKFFIKEVI